MIEVLDFDPSLSTSDIMKMIAEEKLQAIVHCDTFQPFLFDVNTKQFYNIPEEVDSWRHYIWTYNNNRPSWSKLYKIIV